ncbi:hypothetical protein [Nesterenkonia ebinurensis]|uniref:hypothetical protein n=1 Tax=Nesterenkonia ebinurensis TaxID=2608252 RepID=UPI00123E078E|nr:hypothetical protein [Nesterenkonia ebinurensis]
MAAQLSVAQQAQLDNRDEAGKWQQRTHGEAEDSVDVLGLEEQQRKNEIRYSFTAEFEQAEEKFNTDFEGVPTRFFSADLRGKTLGWRNGSDLDELADALSEPGGMAGRYFDNRGLAGRLCHSVSTLDENRAMTDEQAEELINGLDHVTDLARIDDDEALLSTASKDATRGWLAKMGDTNHRGDRVQRWLLVTDGSHNKMKTFELRRAHGDIAAHQQVTQTDLRSLAGSERIARRTGENIVDANAMYPHFETGSGDYPDDGSGHEDFQQRIYDLKAQGTRACLINVWSGR